MNILYTLTWPASDTEDLPRQVYEQLRTAIASGTRFPFDCPYEVGLLRASATPDATPPACDWALAVLAMRVTTTEVGASAHTLPELDAWFKQCIPAGIPPASVIQHGEATHLKLASELSADYDVVASFGTFVGEPEPETPPTTVPVAADTPPPPLSPEAEALKAAIEQPISTVVKNSIAAARAATASAEARPTPIAVIPPDPNRAARNDTQTFSTCLGIALMAGGVLVIPVSLLIGGLLALGQFSTNPANDGAATTTVTDFILYLACCPIPLLVLGIGMILLGVYLPRWIIKNHS